MDSLLRYVRFTARFIGVLVGIGIVIYILGSFAIVYEASGRPHTVLLSTTYRVPPSDPALLVGFVSFIAVVGLAYSYIDERAKHLVPEWHGGKLVLIAVLSAAVGIGAYTFIVKVLECAPPRSSEEWWAMCTVFGTSAALLLVAVGGPLILTWLWLSSRETR